MHECGGEILDFSSHTGKIIVYCTVFLIGVGVCKSRHKDRLPHV